PLKGVQRPAAGTSPRPASSGGSAAPGPPAHGPKLCPPDHGAPAKALPARSAPATTSTATIDSDVIATAMGKRNRLICLLLCWPPGLRPVGRHVLRAWHTVSLGAGCRAAVPRLS